MKIDYVLSVFQESTQKDRWERLQSVAKAIQHLERPACEFNVIILADSTTPGKMQIKLSQILPDAGWVIHPATKLPHQACEEAFQWYVETQSTADYIAWNHSDDIPYPNRIVKQLALIQKDNAVIQLAGFHFYNTERKTKTPLHFQCNHDAGWNVGYPSGWFIQREATIFPTTEDHIDRFLSHWDVVTLTHNILRGKRINITTEPLFEYCFHPERLSPLEQENEWQRWSQWWENNRNNVDFTLIHTAYPLDRIVILGKFAHHAIGDALRNALEQEGVQVYTIAADREKNNGVNVDVWLIDHPDLIKDCNLYLGWGALIPLASVLTPRYDEFKDAPMIVLQHYLPIDFAAIGNPITYWVTEIVWRRWLLNSTGIQSVKNFIYSYAGAIQYFENEHTYEMLQIPPQNRICIHYSYVPPPSAQTAPKKHLVGFMGTVDNDRSQEITHGDYIQDHIRDLRAQIVTYADRYCGCVVKQKGTAEEYDKFVRQCRAFLNVASPMGLYNERQFEILDKGTVLIQWWYPGLEDLGYIDKINCLLFRNPKELKAKIKYLQYMTNSDLTDMLLAGKQLALRHTYTVRARQLLRFLTQNTGENENDRDVD